MMLFSVKKMGPFPALMCPQPRDWILFNLIFESVNKLFCQIALLFRIKFNFFHFQGVVEALLTTNICEINGQIVSYSCLFRTTKPGQIVSKKIYPVSAVYFFGILICYEKEQGRLTEDFFSFSYDLFCRNKR